MEKRQSNVIAMLGATLKYLDENYSIWSGKAPLVIGVNEAKTNLDAINKAAATQDAVTIGVTDRKTQARHDLEDISLEVADQLAAVAATNSNAELSAGVQLSRSALDQMEANQFILLAERIYKTATEHAVELKVYGVTDEEMTHFQSALAAFKEFTNASRSAYAGRSGATVSLSELVKETRSLFRNRIDKMMTTFRRTAPEFYQGYQSARVIIDRTATHAPPATAKEPKPPIPNGMPSAKTPMGAPIAS